MGFQAVWPRFHKVLYGMSHYLRQITDEVLFSAASSVCKQLLQISGT